MSPPCTVSTLSPTQSVPKALNLYEFFLFDLIEEGTFFVLLSFAFCPPAISDLSVIYTGNLSATLLPNVPMSLHPSIGARQLSDKLYSQTWLNIYPIHMS